MGGSRIDNNSTAFKVHGILLFNFNVSDDIENILLVQKMSVNKLGL